MKPVVSPPGFRIWLWVLALIVASLEFLAKFADGAVENRIPSETDMFSGNSLITFSLVLCMSALVLLVSHRSNSIQYAFYDRFIFALLGLILFSAIMLGRLVTSSPDEGIFDFWNLFAVVSLTNAAVSVVVSFVVHFGVTGLRPDPRKVESDS